jgi:hypothetical protein
MADARQSALCETHAMSRFPSFLGGSLSASVGLGFESRLADGSRLVADLPSRQINTEGRSTIILSSFLDIIIIL